MSDSDSDEDQDRPFSITGFLFGNINEDGQLEGDSVLDNVSIFKTIYGSSFIYLFWIAVKYLTLLLYLIYMGHIVCEYLVYLTLFCSFSCFRSPRSILPVWGTWVWGPSSPSLLPPTMRKRRKTENLSAWIQKVTLSDDTAGRIPVTTQVWCLCHSFLFTPSGWVKSTEDAVDYSDISEVAEDETKKYRQAMGSLQPSRKTGDELPPSSTFTL